jgi:S1-C subfamily serine protease
LIDLDRPVRLPAGAALRALATDAAIDPGSSGGPLVKALTPRAVAAAQSIVRRSSKPSIDSSS